MVGVLPVAQRLGQMTDSTADVMSSMDLADWSEATFNDKEIPLSLLVETLKEDPERYVLRRSKQYPNSSLVGLSSICAMVTLNLPKSAVGYRD